MRQLGQAMPITEAFGNIAGGLPRPRQLDPKSTDLGKASAFEEELLEGHPLAEQEVHPKVFLGWSLQCTYLTSITLCVM